EPVGDVGELQGVPELGRVAAHAVEEVDDRVARIGREPGREVDRTRAMVRRHHRVRDRASPDGAAVGPRPDLRPGREKGGGGEQRGKHRSRVAAAWLSRDYGCAYPRFTRYNLDT